MAAAASSSNTSAATAATSSSIHSHEALSFFDNHPSSFIHLCRRADIDNDRSWQQQGRAQLAGALGLTVAAVDPLHPDADSHQQSSEAGWLLSDEAEQAEVSEMVDWANGAAAAHVRCVTEDLPPAVYAEVSEHVSSVSLIDLSPRGRIDDVIYEKHRDVWERVTRGCALIRIALKQGGEPILRWAVRANRKFTGHEDESNADAHLYCIRGGPPVNRCVVSHKCNGSVLHLAARDILIDGKLVRWIMLGSKKVHVAAVWSAQGGVDDWLTKMKHYTAERHAYVNEMTELVASRLRQRGELILSSLARYRLTLNAEYISSVGSGPVDNSRLHHLPADGNEAMAFMLTFNQLHPGPGCELGLEMMFGLFLMHQWGFQTVSAFTIPINELAAVKSSISHLPDVEGAVLYYFNEQGVVQLEKWKSVGYVVLRAVREKLRPMIYGGKDRPALNQLIEQTQQTRAALKVVIVQLEEAKEPAWKKVSKREKRKAKKEKKKTQHQQQLETDAQDDDGGTSASSAATTASVAAIAEGDANEPQRHSDDSASASASDASDTDAPSNSRDRAASSDSIDSTIHSFSTASLAACSTSSSSSTSHLDLSHPDIDLMGTFLVSIGGTRLSSIGQWRVPFPTDARLQRELRNKIDESFRIHVVERHILCALQTTISKVHARIRAIDHVPMTAEERDRWCQETEGFLRWLMEQVYERQRWPANQVMAQYSHLWTLFRQEKRKETGAAIEGQNADRPHAAST